MKMKKLGMFVLITTLFFGVISPVSALDWEYTDVVVGTLNPSPSGLAVDTSGGMDITWSIGYFDCEGGVNFDDVKDYPIGFVDSQITSTDKYDNDLLMIVIGGPVANAITKDLVNRGRCTINWKTSTGSYQIIEDAWGYNTADVIVVGGKDRWATRKACLYFSGYVVPQLYG